MGTIINALAVVAGGVFGMAIKGGLPKRVSDLLMQALGLCTMFIGMTGAISGMMKIEDGVLVSQGTMLLIASLGIGAVVGELLDIEGKMEQLAERIKKMVHSDDNRFIEGFVANALVICVGAMAVVGALQDGLTHDPSMLITKAILDGIISMVFASALGIGAIFAAVPLFVYQGGITLLAGEWLDDLSTYEDIIINESLARRMGWSPQEAIGKHIIQSYITYTIVGVVKDCHYGAPTLPIPHTGFLVGEQMGLMQRSAGILFKYKEGTWNECRKALEHLYQTECSPENILRLNSEEEVYNNYLRSEEMLTRLLSFASLVCILTAMFGIYSLVTLTCEQRRKEIAIRKVNGATVWNILLLFFREYLIMLCIAALFAFPITYVIIKQWILNYVRQVSISPLPFILIFIGLALTVIAGISWRVWKAANENPAEVIKNE